MPTPIASKGPSTSGDTIIKWQLDILAAEDTPSDIDLLEMALKKCGDVRSLKIVRDGAEVINYLKGEPPFSAPDRQAPNVVFMD